MSSNSPISTTRLGQICNDACDSALSTATQYEHASTQQWNSAIINKILAAMISESSNPSATPAQANGSGAETTASQAPPKYKFAVNSTIIQHLSDPRPTGSEGVATGASTQTGEDSGATSAVSGPDPLQESVSMAPDPVKKVGRRGMHSASGAYWNNEKDGMWSHKYEAGEKLGMDIVIAIMWIAV